jgi:hypothetical protein
VTRVDDDGRGWQHLVNLPHIQTIIDETLQGDSPAIMVGDLNVHESHYGNMDKMFRSFGARDVYDLTGEEPDNTIDACANKLTQVFGQPGKGYVSEGRRWLDSTCLCRDCPSAPGHGHAASAETCGIPNPKGHAIAVAPFRLNGQPHVFVLNDRCQTRILRISPK